MNSLILAVMAAMARYSIEAHPVKQLATQRSRRANQCAASNPNSFWEAPQKSYWYQTPMV